MATLSQKSFAGGEIAPSLYARTDTAKYRLGLRTLRNYYVMRHGGAANRPGSQFVSEVKDSTKKVRLIPFRFNDDQTYILEFGDLYMRVIKDGGQILEASTAITAITQANPAVVTAAGHGLSDGDEIFISGVGGMLELNNRNFKVANVTASTVELTDLGGTNIDSSGFGAYTSGGTIAKVFEIVTPYAEADLAELQFVQSADIVTLAHPNYAPRELSRTADDAWSLDIITFIPEITHPTNGSATAGGAGSLTFKYKVTAIDGDTFEESLSATEATKVITNITQADPAVVSVAAHGYSDGDEVLITGVVGMTEVNDRRFLVANSTAGTFELTDLNGNNIDSTGFTAYSSGGTSARGLILLTSAAAPTTTNPHVITWDAIVGATEYNVYKEVNGVFGFIGIAGAATFSDDGVTNPDTGDTPPRFFNPFIGADNYPSTVSYIQQRLTFANTNNDPEKVFMSKTGNFKNFTTSSPIQSDDAIRFTMAGRQVNEVRHLLDLGSMVIITTSGEWVVQGDNAGVVTPGEINLKQQTYHGASPVYPLIIGGDALFIQARESIVRDLAFDFEFDGYRGNDLTIFSSHLVDGYTLTDWTYQQIPHSIVWAVRSDGVLLGLTYLREQQMLAWHRHDFDGGLVENVASIPQGDEDELYVVVKRTINGRSVRYIERMGQRRVDDIEDSIFMDSALSFNGTNTGSTTMTLSGGTTWAFDETITLTASASFFSAADVGNQIHLNDASGDIIRFTIEGFTSATVVTGKPHKTVPVSLRNVAVTTFGKAVDELLGLDHLEGKDVSVFADGYVAASPNNEAYTTVTVTGGKVTLDKAYVIIHVGLPFISDIETLDVDTSSGETLADRKEKVSNVTLYVEETRGLWAGPKPPSDDTVDPLEDLFEYKLRNAEDYDSPVELKTDTIGVRIKSEWNSNGRVFIRQVDPLPSTVLAIHPEGQFAFRG